MKRLRFLAVLGLLLAVAGGAVLFVLYRQVAAFRSTPYGSDLEKVVDIPMGSSPRAVVRQLARAGVLSDETLARWLVRYVKRDGRTMRAGEYVFAGRLKPDEVLEKVYRGEFKTYRFTIPEGLRMEEIATIVQKSGLAKALDLLATMRDPHIATGLGVPFPNLEGYLFPDTYTFTKGPAPGAIVGAMVARFKEEYRKANGNRAPGIAFTEGEIAILASIIEKETGAPEERPRISCVFHNRLRQGILLQTDPTVMYAKMLRNGGQWSKNITKADLIAPHPYNTYTTAGLPPGPIASPGAAAIAAALQPSQCNDLFFVSKNDGSHVFCPDLACHTAAVKKWQTDFFRKRPPETGAVTTEIVRTPARSVRHRSTAPARRPTAATAPVRNRPRPLAPKRHR